MFLLNMFNMGVLLVLLCTISTSWGFLLPVTPFIRPRVRFSAPQVASEAAGGFDWEDPTGALHHTVQNPFENGDVAKLESGTELDPARILAPRLGGVNVYLIGMMGSGKSAVGTILADRMKYYQFIDTDELIEHVAEKKIPEIFEQVGEQGFRDLESRVLEASYCYSKTVVSTGGGLPVKPENWAYLHSGIVVWLDVDPAVIYDRIKGTDRPLLQCEDPLQKLKDLTEKRKDMYSNADLRVEITADMNRAQVVDQLVRDIHYFLDENPPEWKKAKLPTPAPEVSSDPDDITPVDEFWSEGMPPNEDHPYDMPRID
eukprot:Nitzschia sp. Nitz4//scaffold119_size111653//23992//25021//NITZ4_004181-RA/size111653-augustus-gene-0.208-mRNA-1//1//CDS//3329533809//2636//frame0